MNGSEHQNKSYIIYVESRYKEKGILKEMKNQKKEFPGRMIPLLGRDLSSIRSVR